MDNLKKKLFYSPSISWGEINDEVFVFGELNGNIYLFRKLEREIWKQIKKGITISFLLDLMQK